MDRIDKGSVVDVKDDRTPEQKALFSSALGKGGALNIWYGHAYTTVLILDCPLRRFGILTYFVLFLLVCVFWGGGTLADWPISDVSGPSAPPWRPWHHAEIRRPQDWRSFSPDRCTFGPVTQPRTPTPPSPPTTVTANHNQPPPPITNHHQPPP